MLTKKNKKYAKINDKKRSADHCVALHDNEEQRINWKLEAAAIIDDIRDHVADIHISEKLPSSDCNIYLNVRTIEGATYCVCASAIGFRLVSDEFDNINDVNSRTQNGSEVFESMYALLDQLSPRYVESFGHGLCMKLARLQQQLQQENTATETHVESSNSHDKFAPRQTLTCDSALQRPNSIIAK